MVTLVRSSVFDAWLRRLADQTARARILHRLAHAELGHFADCKPIGGGVSEMRVRHGPGYRVCFVRSGATVCVLLCGGTKGTQARDITRARAMARELKEDKR